MTNKMKKINKTDPIPLFTNPDVIVIGSHKSNNGPKAELSLGDGTKLYFPMLDVSKGSQTDRIQVDVTLDGSINVSGGVNNGVGSYQMQFLDGPLVDLSQLHGEKINTGNIKGTAAQQYLSAKKLDDRKIIVKIFTSQSSCNSGKGTVFSSKPMAEFYGIATSIHITVDSSNDLPTITTQIDAVGSWKAS